MPASAAPASAAPASAAPAAPKIRGVVAGGDSIAVLWNPAAHTSPASYTVYRKSSSGAELLLATVPVPPSGGRTTNTARFVDKAVVRGKAYSYTVTMTATDGSVSARSAAKSGTLPKADKTTKVPDVAVADDKYKPALDLGAALIKDWYPKFADRLTGLSYTATPAITLTHVPHPPGSNAVAWASGNSIVFDETALDDFIASTDPLSRARFMAVYLHEMTHIIQWYPHYDDDYLAEGIAVWATHEIYNDANIDTSPALDQSQYYTRPYEPNARFLKWVATKGPWTSTTLLPKNLVRDANVAAHNGTYDVSSFFQTRTGLTAAQLWGRMADIPGIVDQKFQYGTSAMCLENGEQFTEDAPAYLGDCWKTGRQIVASIPVSPAPAVQLLAYGKCLDVRGGSLNPPDGTSVIVYTCTAGAPQQYWRIAADGTIRHNASDKCIQSVGGSTAPYAPLEVRTCNGSNAQKWTRQPL